MRIKYLILPIIIASLFLLFQVGCQQQAKIPTESETTLTTTKQATGPEKTEPKEEAVTIGPKITFEKLVYDFNEVGPSTKNTGEFKLTNTGDSLLKITKVEGCCGVVTKLEKMQYMPGESGTIKVEYTAAMGSGVMKRQLHVVSNDATMPSTELTIIAKITPKVDNEPKNLNLVLTAENAGCSKITLSSIDNKPFSIKAFISTGDCITADFDPNMEATKFVLTPKVDIEKLQTSPDGIIRIDLTHPGTGGVVIPFNTLSEFKITPPQIIAFNAEPGKPIARKIWIFNNYGKDFEIESVSSENNIIKVISQDKIQNGFQFMLEIVPPDAEDKTRFTDVLFVNIKGADKLKITCNGFYLKRK
jgi:hypothetical protein